MAKRNNIKKSELAKTIAANANCTQEVALMHINYLVDIIKEETKTGKTIEIRGFGTFSYKHGVERSVRDFVGKKTITGKTKDRLRFKPHVLC